MLCQRSPRARRHALYGAGLAFGAPGGWLALRALSGSLHGGVITEIASHATLYGYLSVSTAAAFALFGTFSGHLIDVLEGANRRLADAALTDSLTGLKNTRYFHARLLEETARARRHGSSLGLVMGDLDHFKRVNDSHGHAVGDKMLAAVGGVIAQSVRAGDSACRIGGEELAVICPNATISDARQVADRIRQAVSGVRVPLGEAEIGVTVTLGVATLKGDESSEQLLAAADAALYAGKKAGRDRVAVRQ
jgi:diguanylate cyclase (GGDEF)-like protein